MARGAEDGAVVGPLVQQRTVGSLSVPTAQPWLWARIENWYLPKVRNHSSPEDSFFEALKRLGDWTDADTMLVMREYRRFLYLKALTGETLTPPESVDKAWHLHMDQVPDWEAFQKALGVCVPHQTDIVWPAIRASYDRAYERYRQVFREEPPGVIWPDPAGLDAYLRARRRAKVLVAPGLALVALGILVGSLWSSGLGGLIFLIGGATLVAALFLPLRSPFGPETLSNCG